MEKESPKLIVGAAHGSLMSANLLAGYLSCELYFIRYSVFKRKDTEPIVSERDIEFLRRFSDRPVVLFDEDVAGGGTLAAFSARLSPLFSHVSTASVLCCAYSPFRPDYTARFWYD
jgi:hypoxanthine phosphoribosyltransferase